MQKQTTTNATREKEDFFIGTTRSEVAFRKAAQLTSSSGRETRHLYFDNDAEAEQLCKFQKRREALRGNDGVQNV